MTLLANSISFDEPVPFLEASEKLDSLGLLPTSMSSLQIREHIAADILERSIFSARTTKAEILGQYKLQLKNLLTGGLNGAEARARVQDLYDELGYDPQTGFADDDDGADVPPAEKGSLHDLSSNARVDLVLRTNVSQVANFGFREQGQSEFSRYMYPCYELVRIYPRAVPRGLKRVKAGIVEDPGKDWPSRWYEAGGQFYGGGRMIARKDSPIWAALGDPSEFPDAMDTDLPPFAFNSGYGWRQVRRDECIRLGVIKESDDVAATPVALNAGVKTDVSDLAPELRTAIMKGLDAELEAGKIKLKAAVITTRNDLAAAGANATRQQKRAAEAAEFEAKYFGGGK